MPTNNSPSRRARLGAVTTFSLTAVGIGAALAVPAAVDDPIFEAIEDHRRATQALTKAVKAADLPGRGRPDVRICIGQKKEGRGRE